MKSHSTLCTLHSTLLLLLFSPAVFAEYKIGQMCHLKGQEQAMIRGLGIVTGLNGTGDNPQELGPLGRMLIRQLENSGSPMMGLPPTSPRDRGGPNPMKEVGTMKNVALVEVMVTIPATGARSGEVLDVHVSSLGKASSLEHGTLAATVLTEPIPQDPRRMRELGRAWGKITLDNDRGKNGGTIKAGSNGGCRLTADFFHPFVKEDCITLVLHRHYAGWPMAAAIAEAINALSPRAAAAGKPIATAINQQNVVIQIPQGDLADPVGFAAAIMEIPVDAEAYGFEPLPRIVVHEKAGVISGGEKVKISPVFVSHQNITIEVAQPDVPPPQRWVPMDVDGKLGTPPPGDDPRLAALCATLNAVKVPTKDMIAIIKNLHHQGAIQAEVIYE